MKKETKYICEIYETQIHIPILLYKYDVMRKKQVFAGSYLSSLGLNERLEKTIVSIRNALLNHIHSSFKAILIMKSRSKKDEQEIKHQLRNAIKNKVLKRC